jgi:hypothetical protein
MAAIASGLNFSTLSESGIALDLCYTINTTTNPEYPALPFALGTRTIGLDGSTWIFAKPAANYAIGVVGYFDTSWNFTALTTANATLTGNFVGVMSQVASTTSTVTSTNYDGVWVQTSGLCPAISGYTSTSANAQLYTCTPGSYPGSAALAGMMTSSSANSAVAIDGIILTTAVGSGGVANAVGLLNFPQVNLSA